MDVEEVRAFWRTVRAYPAGADLNDKSDMRDRRLLVVSGWACERVRTGGQASVCSLALPGDVIDLVAGWIPRQAIALTAIQVLDCGALLGGRHTAVAAGIERALEEGEFRIYEHALRLGRLNGRERVLHLFLEIYDRLAAVGRAKDGAFRLPLTREFIADFLGLSLAHLKRTLHDLQQGGLITLDRTQVTLASRGLAELACYERAAGRAKAAA